MTRRLRIAERVRRFAARDPFERLWFAPAWIGLGLAGLAIRMLSFRRIGPWLGRYCGTAGPSLATSSTGRSRALQIRRTVQLAVRYAPWRADCYPQAIVARALLGLYRLPSCVSMGLKRDPATGEPQAHAWVRSGSTIVTGGDGARDYKVVAVFVSRDGAS